MSVIRDLVISAIRDGKVLAFHYDGFNREVEPHAVGVSKTGKDVMRGYQISGGHVRPWHEWSIFNLAKVQRMSLSEKGFETRRGYEKGDLGMTRIYAER